MGMNQTPASERIHIGIFGKRNAGKSSIINAITAQDIAIVSEIRGTTTDPVYKAMELLPLGPVMLIDTPGLDDEGTLGELRIQKGMEVLRKIDLALLVVDGNSGMGKEDLALIQAFKEREITYLIVYNKSDLGFEREDEGQSVQVSARTGQGISELKERMARMIPKPKSRQRLAGDLIDPMDLVVLIVPIDKAAPKGRLILPQQQTIRDILESGAVSVVVRDSELKDTLKSLGRKPKLVITDSQVFGKVAAETPKDILLTSFSILFARYKGSLEQSLRGVKALDQIRDGDKILIAEGCTHHRQCDDIGTVKLPRWIREYTGKNPEFVFTSGTGFEQDLSGCRLIVHCGGCMLNEREMKYRYGCGENQGIPMTNYGILIARMKGILKRSIEPFPELLELLEKEEAKQDKNGGGR